MITVLGAIAFVLIFVVIFQIAKTSELMSVLKGEEEGEVSNETNNLSSLFLLSFLILGMIGVFWSVYKFYPLFLPEAASIHGVVLDSIFNITLFFTGIVFVITQVLLFWFAFRYRGKKEGQAYYYPHNNKLEIVWTVIPAIVLTVLVIFGIKAWLKTTGPEPEDSLVVEATGQQFNWIIRYPGQDNELGKSTFEEVSAQNNVGVVWSDKNSHDDFFASEIHLPVNKAVLFKLGAKDVLHSFYLPHFRVKQDCVPGIPTRFWFTPTITTAQMREKLGDENFNYVLACAELCGQAHWNMKVNVIVEEEEAYNQWVAEQEPAYNAVKASIGDTDTEDESASEISQNTESQPEEASH